MKLLALATLYALAVAKHEKYIGWKSYFVRTSTDEQVIKLISLSAKLDIDLLTTPNVRHESLILVQPKHQEELTKTLSILGINYRTHAENIKSLLDHDDKVIQEWTKSIARKGDLRMPYDNYQSYDVIKNYTDEIAQKYHETVTSVKTAFSFERRPIKYMKISSTNFEDEKKPIIFIEAGMHAREWIAPPTVTWVIRQLTEHLTERDLLEEQDWILIPVSNPDGYEYSFTNDRYWRKTRSTNTHYRANDCPGVDGNRNFDYFWNTTGTNGDPCSDIYPGNHPFSELETRLIRDIIQQYRHRIALFLSMHSYGSMIVYPWSHDGSNSHRDIYLHIVAIAMSSAIKYHSLPNFPGYTVGNAALILNYTASGCSKDYAHALGIPLTYTIELPALSRDLEGFHLEPKYIKQVCAETWAGIKVGVRRATQLFKHGYL